VWTSGLSIPATPRRVIVNFKGDRGVSKNKNLKVKCEPKLEFPGGWRRGDVVIKIKLSIVGEEFMFSGNIH